MKYSALALISTVILVGACAKQEQNLTKREILRVAAQVDEIHVQTISATGAVGAPVRHDKPTDAFYELIESLRNSENKGTYVQSLSDRRVSLYSKGREVMVLDGVSGSGQFVWVALGQTKRRSNYVYLPTVDIVPSK